MFWHSSECISDKNCHLNKTKLCEKAGIKLIYIWEDMWKFENKKLKTFIKNVLTDAKFIQKFYKISQKTKKVVVDRQLFNLSFSLPGFKLLKVSRPKKYSS